MSNRKKMGLTNRPYCDMHDSNHLHVQLSYIWGRVRKNSHLYTMPNCTLSKSLMLLQQLTCRNNLLSLSSSMSNSSSRSISQSYVPSSLCKQQHMDYCYHLTNQLLTDNTQNRALQIKDNPQHCVSN